MPSFIEIDKNGSLPPASTSGKIILGADLNGLISVINENGETTNSPIYELTFSELQDKISNSMLIVGSLYKIMDADNTLYGGTEIILQAVSTTGLNTRGVGKFYNPKYDLNVDGYGIWTNKGTFSATNLSGDFEFREEIIGDDGQTGYLSGTAWDGDMIYFTPESGNWSVSGITITGVNSTNTAQIYNISLPSYITGSTTIYGGKVWANLTGEVGDTLYAGCCPGPSAFELDSTNWEVVNYNETDYNVSWDEIEFDLTNNFIVSRKETIGNNFVEQSFQNYLDWGTFGSFGYYWRSIKAFQWGNPFKDDYNLGIGENTVSNSFVETVNFRGATFLKNIINTDCMFGEGSYESNTYIEQNTLNNVYFWDNYFGGGEDKSFSYNKFQNVSFYSSDISKQGRIENNIWTNTNSYGNHLLQSEINSNIVNNSTISNNTLLFCGYNGLTNNNVFYSIISDNYSNNTYMCVNDLSNSVLTHNESYSNTNINNNTLNNGSLIYNNFTDTDVQSNNITNNSGISYNTGNTNSQMSANNLSSASAINSNVIGIGGLINSNSLMSSSIIQSNINVISIANNTVVCAQQINGETNYSGNFVQP